MAAKTEVRNDIDEFNASIATVSVGESIYDDIKEVPAEVWRFADKHSNWHFCITMMKCGYQLRLRLRLMEDIVDQLVERRDPYYATFGTDVFKRLTTNVWMFDPDMYNLIYELKKSASKLAGLTIRFDKNGVPDAHKRGV